jgi:1,4-dihydroxy-2-naphthoate octaprenyltransferase
MLLRSTIRLLRAAKIIAATLRAAFFPASILPVSLGSILALNRTGRWDWGLFGWTCAGVVCLHASANVANDYFDHESGNDDINRSFIRPFTGGSRTVQRGLITPARLAFLSAVCLVLGLVAAVYLSIRVGPYVLVLGGIGVLSGYYYTAPPLRLAARGWGEVMVGLNFGVLPVVGSFFVQTGEWSWAPVVVSLPLAVLIVALLVVNQIPDYEADMAVRKRNWVVRLGRQRGSVLYAVLMSAWIPALFSAVWLGYAPGTMLVALAGILPAIPAIRTVIELHSAPAKLAPACVLTVFLHALVGAIMCTTLLLAGREAEAFPGSRVFCGSG